MPKLTKRQIEALEIKDKDYFVWDSELSGFGIRVFPTSRKQFVLQYRFGKTSRRMSLGRFGAITPDQARGLALKALVLIRQDVDPQVQKREKRTALTVRDLAQRFDEEHIEVHLKPSTAKEYRRNLKLFILPAIGHLRVIDVTRADIAKYHHDWRDRPYQANRNIEIISKMFNLAELWGLRPDGTNPRRHIKKYPEKKRERYFSAAELQAIGRVLGEMEEERVELPSAIAAVRLLLFTGCRLGEIMTLRWEYVDLQGRRLRLTDPSATIASPPASRISFATAPAASWPRSLTTTLAPCRASSSAWHRPRPPPAPVTIAIFLSSDLLFVTSYHPVQVVHSLAS